MRIDLTRKTSRRVSALAVVAALAVVPSTALAAKPKPKPKPIAPSTYMTLKLSEVQIS